MKTTVAPFITIIMPCYNGGKYLRESLEAFFSQSYLRKKIVVVDGKSTDCSHEILSEFIAEGFPLVWDKTPDKGISDAINIGIRHLTEQEIFGYLGCDDILMPGILAEVANLASVAPKIDGFYFDSINYNVGENRLAYRKCPTSTLSMDNLLKFGTIVGLQNIYIRSEHVINNVFSEHLKYSMDYEYYIRLAKSGVSSFCHLHKPSTINIMDQNVSTVFRFEGSFEAITAAAEQVGYGPRLLYRLVLLKVAQLKSWLIRL